MAQATIATTPPRSIATIAAEIQRDWKPVNYAAQPYLNAMFGLDKVTDRCGYDSATSIINYFLSNAATWRGETAKRIKAELRQLVKMNK